MYNSIEHNKKKCNLILNIIENQGSSIKLITTIETYAHQPKFE